MKISSTLLSWISIVNCWDSPSAFNHSKVFGTCIMTSTKLYYLADRSIDGQVQLNQTNNLWSLDFQKDFNTDDRIWRRENYTGSLEPIENSRITTDKTERMFIITKKNVKSNETEMAVNMFSLKDSSWSIISSKNQAPIHYPETRVLYLGGKNKLLVIGGFNGDLKNGTNSLSIFDLSTHSWNMLPDMQPPRVNYTVNYINNTLYFLGGMNPLDRTLYPLTQITKFDMLKNQWAILQLDNSDPPPPRINHMSAVSYSNLYLYGGTDLNERTFFNGVYLLDFTKNKWLRSSTNDLEYEAPVTRGCLAGHANYLVIAYGYNQMGGAGTKLIDVTTWTIVNQYNSQLANTYISKMEELKKESSEFKLIGVVYWGIGVGLSMVLAFILYRWYRFHNRKPKSIGKPIVWPQVNEKYQNYPTWLQKFVLPKTLGTYPTMQLLPVWSEASTRLDTESIKEGGTRNFSKLFRLSGLEPDKNELVYGITECIQPMKPPNAFHHGVAGYRAKEEPLEGATAFESNPNFSQLTSTDITLAIIPSNQDREISTKLSDDDDGI